MTRGRDPRSSVAASGDAVQLDLFGPAMPVRLRDHPLCAVWGAMNTRCFNPKADKFKYYGGRGIVVSEEWRGSSRPFIAWALSNGWKPGLQIDRRDNDGPYSPGNCQFVTVSENLLNRRDTVRLADGRAAWPVARRAGVPPGTFSGRIRGGWSAEQAAGIAPPPQGRSVRLSDGRSAWPQAQRNGVSRSAFDNRLHRGWTPEQAAGIAPPPQHLQNGAGQAQPASDGRRRRKTDKPASQPSPGRCEATKQKRGAQDE